MLIDMFVVRFWLNVVRLIRASLANRNPVRDILISSSFGVFWPRLSRRPFPTASRRCRVFTARLLGSQLIVGRQPRRIGPIQRVVIDVGVPVQPILVADGVGLERLIPLTRPGRTAADFPRRGLGLRRAV